MLHFARPLTQEKIVSPCDKYWLKEISFASKVRDNYTACSEMKCTDQPNHKGGKLKFHNQGEMMRR